MLAGTVDAVSISSSVPTTIEIIGTISARYDMPIGVEGDGGRVSAIYVEAGDRVKKGQVLARLNVTVLQPIKKMNAVHVTAMANLAPARPGAVKAPIGREVRVERLSKDRMLEERRSMDRYRAISNGRRNSRSTDCVWRSSP